MAKTLNENTPVQVVAGKLVWVVCILAFTLGGVLIKQQISIATMLQVLSSHVAEDRIKDSGDVLMALRAAETKK